MILGPNLSHGNIETLSQAILDAPQHLPFIFQTPRLTNQQPHTEGSDNHFSLQRSLNLFHAIRLDGIADLDIVVTSDLYAALKILAHLADVFFEALERIQACRAVG